MLGDLHCHSHISDGSMGVDDLIFYAKRAGLQFVALTDHDTMAGVKRAEQVGLRCGIGVVGGAEFSSIDPARGRKAHLLCYLPQKADRLEGAFHRATERRENALRESARLVMRRYPVTEEHILRYAAGAGSLFSVHIMLALLDLGYADSLYGALYQELLGARGSCFVPHEYPDVREIAALIHSAGGVCVLAHPSVYGSIELMGELAAEGLIDGVERYHPRTKPADIPAIDAVIARYGLIATGGTDFHGANSPHPRHIGTCVTQQDELERLFQFVKTRSLTDNR